MGEGFQNEKIPQYGSISALHVFMILFIHVNCGAHTKPNTHIFEFIFRNLLHCISPERGEERGGGG